MDQTLLDIGSGRGSALVPDAWRGPRWRRVRVDLDPAAEPDVIASVTDLSPIEDGSAHAVIASHVLEHLYAHEVPVALAEIHRVLRPGGNVLVGVPDLHAIAQAIAAGGIESVVYESPAGPVTPLDQLYGLRSAIAGGAEGMAHRTGFDERLLAAGLKEAGFERVVISRDPNGLWAHALRP